MNATLIVALALWTGIAAQPQTAAWTCRPEKLVVGGRKQHGLKPILLGYVKAATHYRCLLLGHESGGVPNSSQPMSGATPMGRNTPSISNMAHLDRMGRAGSPVSMQGEPAFK